MQFPTKALLKYVCLSALLNLIISTTALSVEVPLSLFPIENYSQSSNKWLSPDDANYNVALLSVDEQKKRLKEFYNHFYAINKKNSFSPWSGAFVDEVFNQQADIKTLEEDLVAHYSEPARIGYGENFRLHSSLWLKKIICGLSNSLRCHTNQ
jgi:hypothetical protein